ncbi:MAG: ATP-binding protein [Algoriphagus aquaeductus]|uniref:sensor histidine kinase n=1 Tax=Algoriphagus TaxID=246875 RepID=UPI00258F0FE4|nr:HAMP domain-containing sensor histidine kinase [Algoriphagus sp.]
MLNRFFTKENDPGNLEQLQHRIALIFVFLTFSAILIFGVTDYLLGLNPILGKIRVVYAILFAACFVLMVRYQKFFLAMNLMLGLILAFSMVNYFFNDGFQGPTIFNLFVFVVAVAIFFKKPWNLIWWLACIGGYLLLFYLEIREVILVSKNYSLPMDLFWDNAISIFLCAIFIFIGIYLLIINYQKQQENLLSLQKENEQQLAELTSLDRKKNDLIALLSHDLKGPIYSLNSTLELVEQGILDGRELGEILELLKSQSFQLNQVLDNTLDWVTSELETKSSEKHLTDLKQLGELMKETMQIQAMRKNQRIEFELFGSNQQVYLESKEVKIILKNLLDNAIKFAKSGEIIRLHLVLSPEQIRWEVLNPGENIPEELQPSLFEFGAKSSFGTQKEKGTGIGLSLCKKIAESLGMKLGYQAASPNTNLFFLEIAIN